MYNQFNGVVLDENEGKHIAETLGTKKVCIRRWPPTYSKCIRVGYTEPCVSLQAAILQNHGLLVATNTIEATVFFYIALERACQAQLMADAAAGAHGRRPVRIPDEEARKTGKTNGTLVAGWFQGLTEFGLLEAKEGRNFSNSLSQRSAAEGGFCETLELISILEAARSCCILSLSKCYLAMVALTLLVQAVYGAHGGLPKR